VLARVYPAPMTTQVPAWIRNDFSRVRLGDVRRERRLHRMIAAASKRPAGRVSEVFDEAAERQAAYDFLEHDHVDEGAVRRAAGMACARTCSGQDEVLVVVDGTSLSLSDDGSKGFGRVGTYAGGGRGLKALTSLALTTEGTPLGIPCLFFWARQMPTRDDSRNRTYRRPGDRESRYWREVVDETAARFRYDAPTTKLHFIADREFDASLFMRHLIDEGHDFTIRAQGTRKALIDGERVDLLRPLHDSRVRAVVKLEVPAGTQRAARSARLVVRAAKVDMVLRDAATKQEKVKRLTVVRAHETGTCPRGERPLDWTLYTTADVATAQDAVDTVARYAKRWRIEDFHRTWKRGACRVEETQLRSSAAVMKWATILAVVAARAERLRHLARTEPEAPATVELTDSEIEALIMMKRSRKKKNEVVPNDVPNIAQAVRWIADLGGYVGSKSSGPPGATVIARGLERVLMWEELLVVARESGKIR
jgi:hypothetical protein